MKLTGSIAKKTSSYLGSAHFIAGHHKVPRIWIIVADKHIAKIFSKAGDSIQLIGEALPSKEGTNNMDDMDIGIVKIFACDPAKISYEPSMSPVRRRAFKFSHEIAAWLDQALEKDAFDRLIIVAPPQTLGDLRIAISKPVSSRLVAEINKDLTKLHEKDLREGLKKISLI